MQGLYLACGLIVRGSKIEISDLTRNVEKLQKKLPMVSWNKEGFKVGLCRKPPLNMQYSLLSLSNNTCIREVFERLRSKFLKIYKHKSFIHHYTEFIDISKFE